MLRTTLALLALLVPALGHAGAELMISSFKTVTIDVDGMTVSSVTGSSRVHLRDVEPGQHEVRFLPILGHKVLYNGTVEVPPDTVVHLDWGRDGATVTMDSAPAAAGPPADPELAPLPLSELETQEAVPFSEDPVAPEPPVEPPVVEPAPAVVAAATEPEVAPPAPPTEDETPDFRVLRPAPGRGLVIFAVPTGERAVVHIQGGRTVRLRHAPWGWLELDPGTYDVQIRDGSDTSDWYQGRLSIDAGARLLMRFGEEQPPTLHKAPE